MDAKKNPSITAGHAALCERVYMLGDGRDAQARKTDRRQQTDQKTRDRDKDERLEFFSSTGGGEFPPTACKSSEKALLPLAVS